MNLVNVAPGAPEVLGLAKQVGEQQFVFYFDLILVLKEEDLGLESLD